MEICPQKYEQTSLKLTVVGYTYLSDWSPLQETAAMSNL